DEARLLEALAKPAQQLRTLVWPSHVEIPDHRHRRLLRSCHHRPRGRSTAEERDEFSPPHSITSSARASSVGGIVRPSALAVFKLRTSSNFVGACTGRSAGFSRANWLVPEPRAVSRRTAT